MTYKITQAIKTCSACPTQWELTLDDGRMIYLRGRWGNLTLSISSEPTNNISDAVKGEEIFSCAFGDEQWSGSLEFAEIKGLTKNILNWDETK